MNKICFCAACGKVIKSHNSVSVKFMMKIDFDESDRVCNEECLKAYLKLKADGEAQLIASGKEYCPSCHGFHKVTKGSVLGCMDRIMPKTAVADIAQTKSQARIVNAARAANTAWLAHNADKLAPDLSNHYTARQLSTEFAHAMLALGLALEGE